MRFSDCKFYKIFSEYFIIIMFIHIFFGLVQIYVSKMLIVNFIQFF